MFIKSTERFFKKCFLRKEGLFHNYVALLIIFVSLLFLFNLGKRGLWAPDEPRYAQVASEMWESKDFVLPHLNGEKYPDKPPVHFWLIILFSLPFGKITELSARLPSAMAGIGCVITIYYLGKQIFSSSEEGILNSQSTTDNHQSTQSFNTKRIGFLASLILATSIGFLIVSRRVSFDGLLTFFVTLSLFCFYTGYTRKERNTKFFLLSYVFMGIATLTKGPVGFAIPILVISTFLCIVKFKNYQTEFRIRDMHIGMGGLIVFSIPLLWVLGIYLQGGLEHTKEVVFTQNIGRTVNSWSHNQPFYYFFTTFPLHFLPWSIFIPSVVIHYLKTIKTARCKQVTNGELDNNTMDSGNNPSPFLFPAVWFIVVFTFFSIMSCKRSGYILLLYPAASLFVAWFLDSFISFASDRKFRKIGYIPFKFVYSILIVMSLGFPVWIYYHYRESFGSILPISAVFICGALLSAKYLSKSKPSKALICSFIIFLITVMLGTQTVIPWLNVKKTARYFCENMNRIVGVDDKFACFDLPKKEAYLFYTGRNSIKVIHDINKLNEYFNPSKKAYLLLNARSLEKVRNSVNIKLYTLLKDSIGHRTIVLISNSPFQLNKRLTP